MPIAYSYARFSSKPQEKGASLERQKNLALNYARDHGLVLDQTTYRDLGVSAFRGKNARHGALSVFLKAVEDGKVARGSILLVEAFDRLSRAEPWEAFKIFQKIIDLGITLITLEDGFVYSIDILKKEQHKIFVVHSHLISAHNESKLKSERVSDAIRKRKLDGRLPTSRVPTWMKFTKGYMSAELIPSRAKIVKYIFDEVIDGTGAREIARKLNAKKAPVLFYATEWRQSAISQLLKNPAVYGEFKGQICLPAVITKARWLKAQQIIRDRTLYKGGFSRNNPNNSLVGLAKCYCGRPMRYLPRTDGSVYIKCVGSADNGVCDGRLFPFVACETALVHHLAMIESTQGITRLIYTEKNEALQLIEAEIAIVQGKQERLIKTVEVAGDIGTIGIQLKKHEAEIKRLNGERELLGPITDDVDDSLDLFMDYDILLDAGIPEENEEFEMGTKTGVSDIVEMRRRLKMAFVRVLSKIEFYNADKKKWIPTMRLTYVNGRTTTVDVVPFLSERTKKWIENGTYHRRDMGTRRVPKKRPTKLLKK